MRDRDVRAALLATLRDQHRHDDSLILNELELAHGAVRVDIAVVNGSLSGYEIKSPADTLQRLPRQQDLYSQVLDHAWLVAPPDKIELVSRTLPSWWGLLEISGEPDATLSVVRHSNRNPSHDPFLVASLLWRQEVVDILCARELLTPKTSATRVELWLMAAEALHIDALRDEVRAAFKRRSSWRSGAQRGPNGARSRRDARARASQAPPYHPQSLE